jgi:hypothetical protein
VAQGITDGLSGMFRTIEQMDWAVGLLRSRYSLPDRLEEGVKDQVEDGEASARMLSCWSKTFITTDVILFLNFYYPIVILRVQL